MQLIKEASSEKLRGGFYTPKPIAQFIMQWALNGIENAHILEPSCGDGVFLEILQEKNLHFDRLKAIEYDENEANKAREIGLQKAEVENVDFHSYCNTTTDRFDLIVGNPPYIRYQYFEKDQQIEADTIFTNAGLKYSKLTNAWVSFVVGSSLLLNDTGKIGFVVPAELLQVSYAKNLRKFLMDTYDKINIISFKKLVFPDIQQEVILLLCERNGMNTNFIEHIELKDANDLDDLDINLLQRNEKAIDPHSNKWTFYFLDQEEIDFLRGLENDDRIQPISRYAKVEVGITTGANKYFTVPNSDVQFYQMQEYAQPLVGRSIQVSSLIFNGDDWLLNNLNGKRSNILIFPERQKITGMPLDYLQYGESIEIHKGYKTSIRDEWQIIPSAWVSDCLFLRRNNRFPKFVVNEANAYTTDTMHRVSCKDGVNARALCASFYNSISLAYTEIVGRSYGGGVLELMPSEVGRIKIPYNHINEKLSNKIDQMFRNGSSIDEILELTDRYLLFDQLGYSQLEIELANGIWKKLSNRRINRGKSK